jgi:hypothetical protein
MRLLQYQTVRKADRLARTERARVEALLRDVAFVLKMTAKVKEEMAEQKRDVTVN